MRRESTKKGMNRKRPPGKSLGEHRLPHRVGKVQKDQQKKKTKRGKPDHWNRRKKDQSGGHGGGLDVLAEGENKNSDPGDSAAEAQPLALRGVSAKSHLTRCWGGGGEGDGGKGHIAEKKGQEGKTRRICLCTTSRKTQTNKAKSISPQRSRNP